MPTPVELGSIVEKQLRVTWSDGHVSTYSWRALRLACPCAYCRGEWRTPRRVDSTTIPDDIRALSIERIGAYALRFGWSGGHNTGIYTFNMLRYELCECDECRAARAASPE